MSREVSGPIHLWREQNKGHFQGMNHFEIGFTESLSITLPDGNAGRRDL